MQRSNVYRGVRLNAFMGRLHLKNHATAFVLWCITSLAKAIGEIMTLKKIHKDISVLDAIFKNS